MEAIRLKDVSKSYGKILALNKLNLSVQEGEIYGFIGPNGAGKSTTIRLLLNYLKHDKGEIKVMGFSPETDEVKIKQITGYVSAESFMYSDMKVADLFAFTENFYKIKSNDRIKKLVDILDIDMNKKFEQLSFGNRKKISIACALLQSPKLLILDEPSNGLDPVIRNNLYDLLKEEQKNGVTIFFSSHVLHEVQKFCSRIGLIKDGVLIKEAPSSEFTNLGYRLVRLETKDDINFAELKGVAAYDRQGQHIQFMYSGSPNELLQVLNQLNINSIHIEEPELESVFMHYFK